MLDRSLSLDGELEVANMAAAGVWVIYGVHAMGASKSLMMHHETRIVYLGSFTAFAWRRRTPRREKEEEEEEKLRQAGVVVAAVWIVRAASRFDPTTCARRPRTVRIRVDLLQPKKNSGSRRGSSLPSRFRWADETWAALRCVALVSSAPRSRRRAALLGSCLRFLSDWHT